MWGLHISGVRVLRKLPCFFLFGFLAACAGQEPPITIPQGSKTVAIASGIGGAIYLDNLAHFGIGSTHELEPVPDWNLDAIILDTVRQALDGRYTVVEGRLDSAKLRDPVRYKTMAEGFATGFAKTPAIYAAHFSSEEAQVFQPNELVTSDPPADVHLLLLPTNIIAGGRHQFHGVGLARRSAVLGVLHNHWVHLGYTLTLIDPHANAYIGSRRAKGETLRSVSGEWWEETLEEMTPAQQEQLRSTIISMLQTSLRETLAAAGLAAQTQ